MRWRNGSYTEASDGFNVMFPYLPGGLDDFVDRVVPELQRRGLSGANTMEKRCARISDCPGPQTAFSKRKAAE